MSEFFQCVEHINVLTLRLKNADDRCSLLAADLRRVKQQLCASQAAAAAASAAVPPPPPQLLLSSSGLLSGSMSLPTDAGAGSSLTADSLSGDRSPSAASLPTSAVVSDSSC